MSFDNDCTCKINRDPVVGMATPTVNSAGTVVDSGCGCGDPMVILKGAGMVFCFMLLLFAPRMFRGIRSYFRARKDVRLRAVEAHAMARIRTQSLRSYRGDR